MTVKLKLRTAFGFLVCMLLGIVIYAVCNYRELQDKIEHIGSTLMPEQNILKEIAADINEFRVTEASHILSLAPSDMDAREKEMEELKKGIAELSKKFMSGTRSADETHQFKEFEDSWRQYLEVNTQLLPLSRRYDSHANIAFLDQATDLYNNKSKPLYIKAKNTINVLVDHSVKATKAKEAEAESLVTNSINNMWIVAALASLISIAIVIVFETTVLRVLLRITGQMKTLAGGNHSIVVEGKDRTDEIGAMANALEIFRNNAEEKLKMEERQKQAELVAQEEKRQMMKNLANDFESGVQGVVTTVASASTELYQTAETMQTTVTKVSKESDIVSGASTQTTASVQSVAASVEEMSASISEIAGQVSKTSALMGDAVNKTTEADKSVQSLTTAVSQIGDILSLIDNIAGQINLLALNATIESARAGDAGKGFAVVASEVKNLASQTAKATETIAEHINNVKSVSGAVAHALEDIHNAITGVSEFTSGIASAVEEQSAATREISTNMQSVSKGIQSISASIGHITGGSADADHAAKETLSAAQMLSQQSELLSLQVKKFLAGIRG